MPKLSTKLSEHRCPACNGTGFPQVKQPAQPGRKIYPARCAMCDGKGRVEAAGSERSCLLLLILGLGGSTILTWDLLAIINF
jgi:hypothetical protein